MTKSRIRTIDFELLRHGPGHGQLLSPLTRYLGLCGNHAPATVTVPFEHQHFLGRLNTLRYQDSEQTRQIQLRDMAERMSETLAKVPGLIAELCETPDSEAAITHLQLVLSAAELALLPFELSDAPEGFPGAGQPMALQKQMPLAITRQVRRANPRDFSWRRPPRILFIAAAPPTAGKIPMEAHVQVLREVVDPWVKFYSHGDRAERRKQLEPHLVLLPRASVNAIENLCRHEAFTHVHILAHGVPIEQGGDLRFGLALHDSHDPARVDKVDGTRLASALRTTQPRLGDALSSPLVVSLASCDSGQVGSVIGAGASIAHALHAAGIPLVVASQFPLTFDGSVVMVRTLYQRLLEGDDPRRILCDLRQQLMLQVPGSHDWASIVAYAALPADLEAQLQDVRLDQAKRSIEAATDLAENLVSKAEKLEQDLLASDSEPIQTARLDVEQRQQIDKALERLEEGKDRLRRLRSSHGPNPSPKINAEISGLIASAEKRESQLCWQVSNLLDEATYKPYRDRSETALKAAAGHYREGFAADPSSHWNLVQFLSLAVVLSQDTEQLGDRWTFARLLAELDLSSHKPEAMGWAHGTLAEIHMLSAAIEPDRAAKSRDAIAGPPNPRRVRQAQTQAVHHARELVRHNGRDSFEVFSTCRQFERYCDWYATISKNPAFEAIAGIASAVLSELR